MGKGRRSVLDISGPCPGVIHTSLLQSAAKHSRMGGGGAAERQNKGNVWDMRIGSIPWGKANYRLTAPCLSVACSSDKMKVTSDQYQLFFPPCYCSKK